MIVDCTNFFGVIFMQKILRLSVCRLKGRILVDVVYYQALGFRRKVLCRFYGLNIIMFGNIVIFEEQSTEVHVTKIAPLAANGDEYHAPLIVSLA